ncbi:MAG TPA: hypothetical protein VIJ63_02840 [Roseiarcus sp.]
MTKASMGVSKTFGVSHWAVFLRALGMAESADGAKAAPIAFPVIACLLIADCLWRLVTPGRPWWSRRLRGGGF